MGGGNMQDIKRSRHSYATFQDSASPRTRDRIRDLVEDMDELQQDLPPGTQSRRSEP